MGGRDLGPAMTFLFWGNSLRKIVAWKDPSPKVGVTAKGGARAFDDGRHLVGAPQAASASASDSRSSRLRNLPLALRGRGWSRNQM